MENSAIRMEQLSVRARDVLRSEANTTRSSQYEPMEQPFGATCANERSEPSERRELLQHVRTNEVSEHMLQKRPKGASSDRRKLLLQVRTDEVSEHMMQKRPKGASSDRRKLLLQVRTNEVSEHMLQKRPEGASSHQRER